MSEQPEAPRTDPVDAYRMPLMDHLRELRDRLVKALLAAAVCIFVAFFFAQPIFEFLVAPMNDVLEARGRGSLAIIDPLEGVVTYLKVAVLAGFFAAAPFIFYQVWQFVAPGLYEKERRLVLPLVLWSTVLLLAGAAFGYFVIFRYGFAFFLSVLSEDTEAMLSIASYLSTAIKLLLAFGVCFELPVVVFFLSRVGLVDARDLVEKGRYALVVIFVVAAIITPPDPLTQVLMAVPLMVLYAASIVIARIFSTKQRAPAEEEG